MKIKLAALAALSTLCLAACETGPGYGPPPRPGPPPYSPPGAQAPIGQRIADLRDRIHAGQASGTLTPGEAQRVLNELGQIEGQMQRMRGPDGRLSPDARRIVEDRLNHLSQTIAWLKHN